VEIGFKETIFSGCGKTVIECVLANQIFASRAQLPLPMIAIFNLKRLITLLPQN
jgi:hypothetical protein